MNSRFTRLGPHIHVILREVVAVNTEALSWLNNSVVITLRSGASIAAPDVTADEAAHFIARLHERDIK